METRSPEWWLVNLYRRLITRQPQIALCEAYYDGRHPLSFTTSEYRQEFSSMLRGV